MDSYLNSSHYDLISPDGCIVSLKQISEFKLEVIVEIKNISDAFLGFHTKEKHTFFNIKSTLAQVGVNSTQKKLILNKKKNSAKVFLELIAISDLAKEMLKYICKNDYIGKLFTEERSRRVRNPEYLTRMFNRKDRFDRPLLSFGNNNKDLVLKKTNSHTIAFLPIKKGVIEYNNQIKSFLPALSKIMSKKDCPTRELLKLYQKFKKNTKTTLNKNEVLLVKTKPLYIRTVFAKVADAYLPKGFHHSAACILEPNTMASGDIYEFHGNSKEELKQIPLEFFTLEPHREFVFFEDRDQLQAEIEKPKTLFKAFETAPKPKNKLAAVFVVKSKQLLNLKEKDWIVKNPKKHAFPLFDDIEKQSYLVEKYIKEQPSYPFLKAIEDGLITSQGILLTRHFPSPLLKRMLLSDLIHRNLKGIYFEYPSRSNDEFFSHEDRAFLLDLAKFAIPVFWIDKTSKKVLQYVLKPLKDAGMFVPLEITHIFRKATLFGVYGSNLIEEGFDTELEKLLSGLIKLKSKLTHPLLSKDIPVALVTGGGTGAMEVGNRVAKKIKILSCANIVDFKTSNGAKIHKQKINPHIDAKMTYRLDRLVERQAEFHLDFPIFLMGGIGTDFELALESVKRKTGSASANPILLFGSPDYWREKITSKFQLNIKTKTIKGAEWISNCFYCIQTAEQGLKIYKDFFENKLPIGRKGPIYKEGFCIDY